jgi:hypothetical protein
MSCWAAVSGAKLPNVACWSGPPATGLARSSPRGPEAQALAGELDRTHPGAAASLREGLAETLTVLRLNVPPTLHTRCAPRTR